MRNNTTRRDQFTLDLITALEKITHHEPGQQMAQVRDHHGADIDYSITREDQTEYEDGVPFNADETTLNELRAEVLEDLSTDHDTNEDTNALMGEVIDWVTELRDNRQVAGVYAVYTTIKDHKPSARLYINITGAHISGLSVDLEITDKAELEEAKDTITAKLEG